MKRKIWSAAAAVLLAVAVFTGCTEQNAQSQAQKTMEGMPQNTIDETSAPPTSTVINGVNIYPMNEFVPQDLGGAIRYSYSITGTKIFDTIEAAGLKASDFSFDGTSNVIDGKSEEPCSSDGTIPDGSALLLLEASVRADGDVPQESIPMISDLTLTVRDSLEGKTHVYIEPVYNSKAPEKDRETQYNHLPKIQKGESESFEVGFILPKKYMTNGTLYVTPYGVNGTITRAIQLEFDGGGKQ